MFDLPSIEWPTVAGTAVIVAILVALIRKKKWLFRKKPQSVGTGAVKTHKPHNATTSATSPRDRYRALLAAWRERWQRIRPLVLPVIASVLLLLAITAAVAVMTWSMLEQPSWDVVGLVLLAGILYGAAASFALAIAIGRYERSQPAKVIGGDASSADVVALQNRMNETDRLLGASPTGDRSKSIIGRLEALERTSGAALTTTTVNELLDKKRYASVTQVSESMQPLKTQLDDVDNRLSRSTATMTALQEQMATVAGDARAAKESIDSLEHAKFASHVFLNGPDEASTLIEGVRSRYLFVWRNQKYRVALAAWARSAELRLVLKHSNELYQYSVRLEDAASDLTPRRRAQWVQLNQRTAERLHAAIPLVDHLVLLGDATDESVETMATILRDLRPFEEKFGWSIVPRPQTDMIPILDAAANERYLRDSARKMLELTVMPLVLLAQEVFEARVHEDGHPADAQYKYENKPFEGDGTRRGSILDAVSSAAKLLGFTYRPIALYSSVQSEAGQLLKPHSHPRVTWQEWIGRDDPRTGVIVRLERPAFTEEPGGKLVYEGASAIIGGPGNAGRD